MAYNGWSNYATWNVALWIDNDQGSYSTRCEMAQECYDDADDMDDAKRSLAEKLKSWVDEMNPLTGQASMFSDILSSALADVDYDEIAANFLEDVDLKEEEEEEEEETV